MLAPLVILLLLALLLQTAAQNVSMLLFDADERVSIEPGGKLQLGFAYKTNRESVTVHTQWQDWDTVSTEYSAITMYYRPEPGQDRQVLHTFAVTTGQTELVVMVDGVMQLSDGAVFTISDRKQPVGGHSAPLKYTGGIVEISLNFSNPLTPQATPSSATTTNGRLVTATVRTAHETVEFGKPFAVQLGEGVQIKTVHWADLRLGSSYQLQTWVSATTQSGTRLRRMDTSAVEIQAVLPRGKSLICSRQEDTKGLNLKFYRP